MTIKLNCDMGESYGIWKMGDDEKIMPLIDMANLACGFHGGDPLIISKSVLMAKENNLAIGAHPSYNDLQGFGRRSIACTSEEIQALILYQIGALDAFCKAHKTKISYVKPHGALYNDMMKDENIFIEIVKTISLYDENLLLMVLARTDNDRYIEIANKYNIKLIHEVFADRNYNDNGTLVSRKEKSAVIHDNEKLKQRIIQIKESSSIQSINNNTLNIKIDTICVHGDNENALEFVKILKDNL